MVDSATYLLSLLTVSNIFGEISHFLLGVTSRDIARDLHYGDRACFTKREALSGPTEICHSLKDHNR